ncbi:hypothetical protein SK128_010868, partial [Halocaridina rubra]
MRKSIFLQISDWIEGQEHRIPYTKLRAYFSKGSHPPLPTGWPVSAPSAHSLWETSALSLPGTKS